MAKRQVVEIAASAGSEVKRWSEADRCSWYGFYTSVMATRRLVGRRFHQYSISPASSIRPIWILIRCRRKKVRKHPRLKQPNKQRLSRALPPCDQNSPGVTTHMPKTVNRLPRYVIPVKDASIFYAHTSRILHLEPILACTERSGFSNMVNQDVWLNTAHPNPMTPKRGNKYWEKKKFGRGCFKIWCCL